MNSMVCILWSNIHVIIKRITRTIIPRLGKREEDEGLVARRGRIGVDRWIMGGNSGWVRGGGEGRNERFRRREKNRWGRRLDF